MITKHNNVRKILFTDNVGCSRECSVAPGTMVTLESVRPMGAVYVDFDTDDDFALRLNDRVMYYDTLYFESVDEAIRALQSIEVVNAGKWSQSGNTFTRNTESHPAEHWFYEWINEAISSLKNGETNFVRSSNWLLKVDVY